MGISLTGLTPATTYDALIKVGDNGPITGALKVLSDGLGTNLPMEASTTAINFTGVLTQAGTTLQPTLVSGTNIKTINGTSVLGSGDIVTPQPSGVAGAIQFSNGSAFASDATNLFWDDTNNRLGIGTNTPDATFKAVGVTNLSTNYTAKFESAAGQGILSVSNNGVVRIGDYTSNGYASQLSFVRPSGATNAGTFVQSNTDLTLTNPHGDFVINGIQTTFKGSGSTSATTSLLVQNSAGAVGLQVKDDGSLSNGGAGNMLLSYSQYWSISGSTSSIGNYISQQGMSFSSNQPFCINVAGGSHQTSSSFQIDSTTKGFLPPRMTTTQKNAIATPSSGLVVYDNTTNKLCCYNGSTWNDLF